MKENFEINITQDKFHIINGEGGSIQDLTQLFCNVLIAQIQMTETQMKKEELKDEAVEAVRKELFDGMNLIFSETLSEAFPDYELRPELTEQAIMEMENQIIARAVEDDNACSDKVVTLDLNKE